MASPLSAAATVDDRRLQPGRVGQRLVRRARRTHRRSGPHRPEPLAAELRRGRFDVRFRRQLAREADAGRRADPGPGAGWHRCGAEAALLARSRSRAARPATVSCHGLRSERAAPGREPDLRPLGLQPRQSRDPEPGSVARPGGARPTPAFFSGRSIIRSSTRRPARCRWSP